MCKAIYAALLLLLLYYSDVVIEEYALSLLGEGESAMVIAIGWEMLAYLWPIGLLLMVLASALTLMVSRALARR